MRLWLSTFIVICLLSTSCTTEVTNQSMNQAFEKIQEKDGIEEYRLKSNGLTVLLKEDHSAPVVAVVVNALAGSRNETEGTRGVAHLLEHMLFKGSPKYNKASGTQVSTTLQSVGALINATTWYDGTNYYELLPSSHLELALDIESDRLRGAFLKAEDFKFEMPVVQSEFDRLENSAPTALYHAVMEKAFTVHPYRFPIIGFRDDIQNLPASRLREFYDLYYWPNNAVLTVIGDLDKAKTLNLIAQKFSPIPQSPNPIPQLKVVEPAQTESRFVEIRRADPLNEIFIAHKIPEILHPDSYALDLLASILSSGKTSRLYKSLVDTSLAAEIRSETGKTHDPSLFSTTALLLEGISHDVVTEKVLSIYREVQESGVTKDELNRAKQQLLAESAFARDGFFSIAGEISQAISIGDWTYFASYPEKISQVTVRDIQKVAQKYLNDPSKTTGYLISAAPEPENESFAATQNIAETPDTVPDQLINPAQAETAQKEKPPTFKKTVEQSKISENTKALSQLVDRIHRSESNGIKIFSVTTAIKDVVSITGSFPLAGLAYSHENPLIPALTIAMLEQGTLNRNRFVIAEELEKRGISVHFRLSEERVGFSARCLKKDVPLTLEIIAEELKEPLFDPAEFEKQKQQLRIGLRHESSSTSAQAEGAFSRSLFDKKYPYYQISFPEQLELLEQTTLEDVKAFHKKHYGSQGLVISAAGDIDSASFSKEVLSAFGGWKKSNAPALTFTPPTLNTPVKQAIYVPDKINYDVIMGHTLPLKRKDPSYIPLSLANFVFGGNFSARLSNTVRDDEGLTYFIQSELSGVEGEYYGSWQIHFIVNERTLKPALNSTLKQLHQFYKDGITEKELSLAKTTLLGNFQVSIATTGGLAAQILRMEELGFGIDYLRNYPSLIEKVTLEEANQTIKKFYNPDKLHITVAGSIKQLD